MSYFATPGVWTEDNTICVDDGVLRKKSSLSDDPVSGWTGLVGMGRLDLQQQGDIRDLFLTPLETKKK